MPIDRRTMLALAALTAAGAIRKSAAADNEHALFWRLNVAGGSPAILFGYERIAASQVPDVVRDGDGFVDGSKRAIQDLPANVKFPPISMDRKQITPVMKSLSKPVGDELRAAFARLPQVVAMADTLSAIEATALLTGEGQSSPIPSAAGTIADHARALNRPATLLITDAEAQTLWNPPDLAALNRSIDEPKIKYLLDLRREVGPIGAHLEQLYRARQGEEINRFTADMRAHGIVSLTSFIAEDRLRPLLMSRLTKALAAPEAGEAFVFLPLGLLTGQNGMLAELRGAGHEVTALA